MLRKLLIVGLALFANSVALSQNPSPLANEQQQRSYALGVSLGDSLRKQSLDLDPELLAKGLKDAISANKTLMSEEEVRTAMNAMKEEFRVKNIAATKELSEKNRKDGDAFLAANKNQPGVVTLDSGLQYKVLTTGEGNKPSLENRVVCNYRGTLIDGTEFDSSYRRKQPATLPLNRVIKGWAEALPLMPVGSKWQLFVPPQLAYGERGSGSNIGPNATLIFEVELVSIENKLPLPASAGKK